ncbi:hypothetical protein PBCV1_a406L [Paramecium bursaria Chlorella virus 1]|uniref:Uncharacterized protein n=1 Tax=Paramecium bursaria Chlorella virus 1 TaxID=10506 RepID=Q98458_PBCV1|nr:hypothetical protein PBCV1_a406L [Paramecium bursaria Chlorella virus 1]AAC96774.1 hypothetical protein [Paramecium bursaria Chlorella virus 1]
MKTTDTTPSVIKLLNINSIEDIPINKATVFTLSFKKSVNLILPTVPWTISKYPFIDFAPYSLTILA